MKFKEPIVLDILQCDKKNECKKTLEKTILDFDDIYDNKDVSIVLLSYNCRQIFS